MHSESSYEISVDLDEAAIGGEDDHNMRDHYFRPVGRNQNPQNPLLRRPDHAREVPCCLDGNMPIRCLLADNSTIFALSLKQAAESYGLQVLTVASYEEALQVYRHDH